jgi:hypothetical protein
MKLLFRNYYFFQQDTASHLQSHEPKIKPSIVGKITNYLFKGKMNLGVIYKEKRGEILIFNVELEISFLSL